MICLIELVTYLDGTASKKSIYTYASIDEAIASYHSEMGKYMKAENVDKIRIIIVDENGIYKEDWWARPIIIEQEVNE